MDTSTSFSISNAQIISVLKGFAIAELGAILATASISIMAGNFDLHSFLLLEGGAISSTAVNFLRKYLPSAPSTPQQ